MTSLGTDILQREGTQLNLLPTHLWSTSQVTPHLPPTLTFTLSHRRETNRGRNFSTPPHNMPFRWASEGGGWNNNLEGPQGGLGGWTFCCCYPPTESGADRKVFGSDPCT